MSMILLNPYRVDSGFGCSLKVETDGFNLEL